MTRKNQILTMLKASNLLRGGDHAMSCAELCRGIITAERLDARRATYLSGSVSTILAAMVKKGELQYDERKTQRGGHLYRLPKDK